MKDNNAIDGISQKEEQIRKEHDAAMAAQEDKGPTPQAGKEITEGAISKDLKDNKSVKDPKVAKNTKEAADATDENDKSAKAVKDTKGTADEQEAGDTKVANGP